jgi:phosphomannomutase/phosphoglucomutase
MHMTHDATPTVSAGKQVPPSIFRTYDIRGVVDETLTEEVVYEIGRAVGSEARDRGQRQVVVARDGRLSGPRFITALTRGVCASGCDVIDIGCTATPVLYFATFHLGTGAGVVVTGSHNPPNYNGLKIVLGGEALAGEAIQDLRRRIEGGRLHDGQGTLSAVDVLPDYIRRIAGDVSLQRPLKVAVDCGNGAAGVVAPRLLRELGCEVFDLFCDIDGHFPNHHPDPSQPENLHALIAAVREHGADVGLAFDGDGDRLGVVDGGGHVIWPDRVMMLYAMDLLERNPGARILFDVKCTRNLAQVIRDHGGEPVMAKTGHSLIKARMKESGALLAGEMSGHIFFKERWYGFDDACYAAARLLEILAKSSRTSSELFASVPEAVSTPELHIRLQEGEHYKFMDQVLAHAGFDGAEVTTIDGLRVDFDDGWGLIRASNTTPWLILRFEGNSQKALKRIQEAFRRLLLEIRPDLALPF